MFLVSVWRFTSGTPEHLWSLQHFFTAGLKAPDQVWSLVKL